MISKNMISRNKKLMMGIIILLAYISVGLFGLFQFSHAETAPMVDCPYAQNGYALCQNTLNHIDDWQEFSNVLLSSLLIFSLLFFGIILYFFLKKSFSIQNYLLFYNHKRYLNKQKSYFYLPKITKWLSLLENSPSF